MKFYNYLNEKELTTEEIADIIEKDCQPFLKKWKKTNNILWSGRKNIKDNFVKKKVRKDRKPRDTISILHDMLNEHFKKKFGKKLRTESLFCAFNSNIAEGYGTGYVTFPINKFEIYWSPKIEDLYIYYKRYLRHENEDFSGLMAEAIESIIAYLKYNKNATFDDYYHNGIYDKFIMKDNNNKIKDSVEKSVKEIVDLYKKGDFEKASYTQNEIMVYCDEVYFIDPYKYGGIKSILMDRGY